MTRTIRTRLSKAAAYHRTRRALEQVSARTAQDLNLTPADARRTAARAVYGD